MEQRTAKPLEVLEEHTPKSVIVARGLTKRYGQNLAVDKLSFEVGWGTVTGFLGPNGAGKTTTLRMILGLAEPTAGQATIDGFVYKHLGDPLHHVGALLETSSFHPRRTARDHLRVLAAAGTIPEQRVDEVLEMVGLTEAARKKVGHFSLGMRQRLGLASALLGDPRLLILDEPANGLDPGGIRWLREFLQSFASAGKTAFVSSHILAEMAQMADEVILINRGRLVVHASIDELTTAATRVVRVRTPESERLRSVLIERGLDARLSAPDQLTIKGATSEQIGSLAAEARVVIFGLDTEAQSLEEVFFDLTDSKEGTR